MTGGAETQLPGFVERGLHDVGSVAEELDPHGPFVGDLTHPGASLIGCREGLVPFGAEEEIGVDPRRRDLIGGALALLVERPIETVAAARIPNRGDAMCQARA